MANPDLDLFDLRTATDAEIVRRMNLGVREALLAHKRAGLPIVEWDYETNPVVLTPADQIVIPESLGGEEPDQANGVLAFENDSTP